MPQHIPLPDDESSPAPISWREANQRGLDLARAGHWRDAASAFEVAGDVIETSAHAGLLSADERDEARATLMSNLAQSHYRAGNYAEAARNAARVCGLRVGLYGEASLSVARARSDLAVILGADGHVDEALSLLDRAMRAVAEKLGNDSSHLLPLLCNAAQMLLSSNQALLAEPYVVRLHALLTALEHDTAPATRMLSFIQALRVDQQQRDSNRTLVNSTGADGGVTPQNDTVQAPTPTPPHTFEERSNEVNSGDRMLRDAIAITGDLLRATPLDNTPVRAVNGAPRIARSAAPAMPPLSESALVMDSLPPIVASFENDTYEATDLRDSEHPHLMLGSGLLDTLDLEEPQARASQQTSVLPPALAAVKTADATEALDGVSFDLVEPPPPTLNVLPEKLPAAARVNPLGFDVEYGIPRDEHLPLEQNVFSAIPDADADTSKAAERRPMRAVGGIRSGRTQVAEPGRLWYVPVIIGAFAAGVAMKAWILPLFR